MKLKLEKNRHRSPLYCLSDCNRCNGMFLFSLPRRPRRDLQGSPNRHNNQLPLGHMAAARKYSFCITVPRAQQEMNSQHEHLPYFATIEPPLSHHIAFRAHDCSPNVVPRLCAAKNQVVVANMAHLSLPRRPRRGLQWSPNKHNNQLPLGHMAAARKYSFCHCPQSSTGDEFSA